MSVDELSWNPTYGQGVSLFTLGTVSAFDKQIVNMLGNPKII